MEPASDLPRRWHSPPFFGEAPQVTLSQIKTYTEMDSHEERLSGLLDRPTVAVLFLDGEPSQREVSLKA